MRWLDFIILDVTKPLCDSVISFDWKSENHTLFTECCTNWVQNTCVVLLKAQEMTGMRVRFYV